MYYAVFLYLLWKYGKYLEYGYNGVYYSYYTGKYIVNHIPHKGTGTKNLDEKDDDDWELV